MLTTPLTILVTVEWVLLVSQNKWYNDIKGRILTKFDGKRIEVRLFEFLETLKKRHKTLRENLQHMIINKSSNNSTPIPITQHRLSYLMMRFHSLGMICFYLNKWKQIMPSEETHHKRMDQTTMDNSYRKTIPEHPDCSHVLVHPTNKPLKRYPSTRKTA
jgi:hypothetical protein